VTELSPEKRAALALLDRGDEYALLFFRKAKGLDIFLPLKKRGWFAPDRNPEPIETEKGLYQIPVWLALDYLLRAAEEAAQSNDPTRTEYAEEIMQILRSVTNPPDGKNRDNYRTWYRFTQILSILPAGVIREDDINLVTQWLDSRFDNTLVAGEIGKRFLPNLLKGGSSHELALARRLIAIVTRIRWIEKTGLRKEKRKDAIPLTDPYWLKELLKTNAKSIGVKCGLPTVQLLAERIETIVKEDNRDRFSYIWRPAIEDHKQNSAQKLEFENILLTALREASLGLIEHNEDAGRQFVEHLLTGGLQSFRRLAFYLIAEKFRQLSDIFCKHLTKDFFDSRVQHELYGLISRRFIDFYEPEKDRIVNLIDQLTAHWREDDSRDDATNYLRLTWLSAVKSKGHAKADSLYGDYLDKVGHEPERPDFPYYTEVGWAQHKSPHAVDELLAMTPAELVRALNDFRSNDWKGPDEDGLATALKDAIRKDSEKFSAILQALLRLRPRYLAAILDAYAELCKMQPVDWQAILSFCLKLVEHGELWTREEEDKLEGWVPKKSWVVTSMGELIRAGLVEDYEHIPDTLLAKTERILVTLVEREPSAAIGTSDDAMTEAINTAKGRCLETLIVYSLRCARSQQAAKGERVTFWNHIKPVYDAQLAKTKEGNYEFTVLAAHWLPSLGYLSSQWIEENINRIFSTTSQPHWLYAVQGYAYVNAVYKEIYSLLRVHGHLRKVVDTVFHHDRVRDKYLEQITVAYLLDDESLNEGSLFRYVLNKWNHDDMHHIIWFLWTQRENVDPAFRERIHKFWRWVANSVEGHEDENKDVLSDLGPLAVFLEKIGEDEKQLLMQSVPYAGLQHHGTFVVKYLDSLADLNPKAIADVFLKMIETFLPDYPEEHVQSLVTKFYEAGLLIEANTICDKYRASMHEFLGDVYARFNP
jgi:hypothetical protein